MGKLEIVKADLIDFAESKTGVFIVHCVNSGNSMGSGVAKALYTRWPQVKSKYHKWFVSKGNLQVSGSATLGNVQYVSLDDYKSNYVVNMIGQDFPGGHTFNFNGKEVHLPPIRYQSLEKCMYHIVDMIYKAKEKKGIKYKIVTCWFGTGLAGGDKKVITELINKVWIDNDIDVTICEL